MQTMIYHYVESVQVLKLLQEMQNALKCARFIPLNSILYNTVRIDDATGNSIGFVFSKPSDGYLPNMVRDFINLADLRHAGYIFALILDSDDMPSNCEREMNYLLERECRYPDALYYMRSESSSACTGFLLNCISNKKKGFIHVNRIETAAARCL